MGRIMDGAFQNAIGQNIKQLRIIKGWSQRNLSERLEEEAVYVCRGSISRIESGERTVSDIEIVGFAKVFGIPVKKIFAGLTWPGSDNGGVK